MSVSDIIDPKAIKLEKDRVFIPAFLYSKTDYQEGGVRGGGQKQSKLDAANYLSVINKAFTPIVHAFAGEHIDRLAEIRQHDIALARASANNWLTKFWSSTNAPHHKMTVESETNYQDQLSPKVEYFQKPDIRADMFLTSYEDGNTDASTMRVMIKFPDSWNQNTKTTENITSIDYRIYNGHRKLHLSSKGSVSSIDELQKVMQGWLIETSNRIGIPTGNAPSQGVNKNKGTKKLELTS